MKKLTLLSLVLSFFTITIQSQNPKEISKYVVLIKVKN